MYQLIGVACGLAIYNGIIININIPEALFKKLLRRWAGSFYNYYDYDTVQRRKFNYCFDITGLYCNTIIVIKLKT